MVGGGCAVGFEFGVAEPFGGPDAVEAPAEAFEVFLAETVAVARGLGGVVLRAVGFDGEDGASRFVGVHCGEVDAVAGDAVLRLEVEAALFEAGFDVDLERVKGRGVDCASAEFAAAASGVFDVVAQHPHALISDAVGVHVVGGEAADDGHAALGAGDGDVEASEAAFLVDGAEVVAHAAVFGASVADGEDDGVALVALDALEVFDEEGFGVGFAEEFVEFGTVAAGEAQGFGDAVGVGCAEGDDAERFVGALGGVAEDQFDDALDFGGVGAADPGGVGLEGDFDMFEAVVGQRAGEGGEATVVDVVVGEGDEALVFAAVVPAEGAGAPGHGQEGAHGVED